MRSEGTRYFFLSRSPIRALGAFSTMTCRGKKRGEGEKRGVGGRGRSPVRENPDAPPPLRETSGGGWGGCRDSPGPCPGTSCGSSPPRSGASRRGAPPCRRTSWRLRRRAEEAATRRTEEGPLHLSSAHARYRRGVGIRRGGRGKRRPGLAEGTPTERFYGLQWAPPPPFRGSGAARDP